jgi:hypothetical protein
MRVKVLLQITGDDGVDGDAMEAAVFEKRTERPEDLGLSIADGKALMAAVQQRVVNAQVTSWTEQHCCCEACGARRRSKGSHPVVFLTLYGDVQIASPRLYCCPCQSTDGPATVSPLRNLLPDYVAPERLYLEARWASLVPYAGAAGLLADILPITAGANATPDPQGTVQSSPAASRRQMCARHLECGAGGAIKQAASDAQLGQLCLSVYLHQSPPARLRSARGRPVAH